MASTNTFKNCLLRLLSTSLQLPSHLQIGRTVVSFVVSFSNFLACVASVQHCRVIPGTPKGRTETCQCRTEREREIILFHTYLSVQCSLGNITHQATILYTSPRGTFCQEVTSKSSRLDCLSWSLGVAGIKRSFWGRKESHLLLVLREAILKCVDQKLSEAFRFACTHHLV